MKAVNLTRGSILADQLQKADTFFSGLLGLMGKKELPTGRALWIIPCQSVHTFWMRFDIDILFLDRELKVIHLVDKMRPFRISRHCPKARSVVELPGGIIRQSGTCLGDQLEIG